MSRDHLSWRSIILGENRWELYGGGNYPGCNCLWGNCPGGNCTRWELPGGNCPRASVQNELIDYLSAH